MAVHVDAITGPVSELIYDVLRKHHRAVLEGVKELHDRTKEAERQRDRLADALRHYGCHRRDCALFSDNPSGRCDCGLSALLAELEEKG